MKGVLKGFAAVLAGVVAVLSVSELLLHVFPSLLPIEIRTLGDNIGIAHPVVGNVFEPGSSGVIRTRDFATPYQLDDHGFRNQGPWPSQADVVVIGDSLVFGYGVSMEDAWPQLLAGLSGRSVLNLGLIGASPQQYLRIYETYARALKPKVVIVGFFAANDFWDAMQFEQWLASGDHGNYRAWRDFGHLTTGDLEHLPGQLALAFRKYIYLPRLLKLGVRELLEEERHSVVLYELPDGTELRLDPDYIAEKTIQASKGQRGFSAALKSLESLRQLAVSDGARFVVVFQPSKEAIYLPLAAHQSPNPSADIREALKVRGIPFLNLAPAFREQAQAREQLFYPSDRHPNAMGYRLIAQQLADWLAADRQEDTSG